MINFRNAICKYNFFYRKIVIKRVITDFSNSVFSNFFRNSYICGCSVVLGNCCSKTGSGVLKITESVGIGTGRGNTSVVKFRFLCRIFVSRFFLR